jgi:glutamine amidotransferase
VISVIDYGMGNLKSVLNALAEIGDEGVLATTSAEIALAEKILLPGVGAFSEAIDNLRKAGFVEALAKHVELGRPLLGICLGMQLICRESTEDGRHEGLGFVDASVLRLPSGPDVKVPHIGWSSLEVERESPVTRGLQSGSDVYFVHSYYVQCNDSSDVIARCTHGTSFCAILGHGNVYGMQFHPEKSQEVGLSLLKNFVDL